MGSALLIMAFFGRAKVSSGLDIGSGLIKLVQIDHSREEPVIVQLATIATPQDTIVEGEIRDPARVAVAIRSLTQMAELAGGEVVASVGGRDVIIKKIQMERMAEVDAREMIGWEAEQHVPFDMESVQLDFQILDPAAAGPDMSVVLVAAKRELVERRLALLDEAGLAAALVDVDAFALHNAFARSYPDLMDGVVALVNVGHETTNLNLLDDGIPVLVRDIPLGLRGLRQALQREHGLSVGEAEGVVRGDPHVRHEALDGLVADRAEELAVGIQRAAAFIMAQSPGRAIGRVFLSGGGARLPGMAEAVANRLAVPTEAANPFERVAVRPEVMQDVAMEELAPMLMLSVGLALRRT